MKCSTTFSGSPRSSPSRSRSSSRRASSCAELAAPVFALLIGALGCQEVGDAFCDEPGCRFTTEEWSRLSSLANLPDPPGDPSNRYVGDARAIALGQRFYYDARFSGSSNLRDTIGRNQPYGRVAKNDPVNVSCASCHDPARGGSDHTSSPNHVSVGAGWYDVNSQPTRNAAHFQLLYWNLRSDSLWSQIVAVSESGVSMNGNRLKNARIIHDHYAVEYAQLFTEYPLPFNDTAAELAARLESDGQCRRDPGCPSDCVEEAVTGTTTMACYPRFPLQGKPGRTAGCQRGDAAEPFGDAFDCMAEADRNAITRVHVNFSKAIAAYEYVLVSKNSLFDQFVNAGPESNLMSGAAIRGAKLFVGKASCIDCHSSPLFSDEGWHNVGVAQLGMAVPTIADCTAGSSCDCVNGTNCLPWGAHAGLTALKASRFRRDSTWSDDPTDESRKKFYDLELTDAMKGAWRTPGLRDVAITAPYMHDGIYETLEEVVHHYNVAIAGTGVVHESLAVQFQPLGLSETEEQDLVEFLKTLTGEPLPAELVEPPPLP